MTLKWVPAIAGVLVIAGCTGRVVHQNIVRQIGETQVNGPPTVRPEAKSESGSLSESGSTLNVFGVDVHGSALLYYQGSRTGDLAGEAADSPGGPGAAGDLELSWIPPFPVVSDGTLYTRIHAGTGTGADKAGNSNTPANTLLANLNTIADDNSDRDNTTIDLLELHYTYDFLKNTFSVTLGKGKSLLFLDANAFANNEKNQFVGKPFVNNSVLDSESEYVPMVGLEFKPADALSLSMVGTSTSRPNVEGTPLSDTSKNKYDPLFSTPFLGGQLTYSPKAGDLEGNYRVYGWYAGYNHSILNADREPVAGRKGKGWGLGLSADQQLTPMIGLFGRVGFNNDDVYVVRWEFSGGMNMKGVIPGRDDDTLGIGVGALLPGDRYNQNDPELHLEAYYHMAITPDLALTPDLQFVLNPGGDSRNDPVVAGMLRLEFSF